MGNLFNDFDHERELHVFESYTPAIYKYFLNLRFHKHLEDIEACRVNLHVNQTSIFLPASRFLVRTAMELMMTKDFGK